MIVNIGDAILIEAIICPVPGPYFFGLCSMTSLIITLAIHAGSIIAYPATSGGISITDDTDLSQPDNNVVVILIIKSTKLTKNTGTHLKIDNNPFVKGQAKPG